MEVIPEKCYNNSLFFYSSLFHKKGFIIDETRGAFHGRWIISREL
jgi:hypothetical protein